MSSSNRQPAACTPERTRPDGGLRHAPRDVIVNFRDVQKSYDGERLVVHDLDLDIERGEFLTLLGPSGSGKTSTLMMLAGFEMPTRGTITLDGRDIGRLPPAKRDIGMVFQNYALFPHMSVGGNIAFPLEVRGFSRADIDRRVARMVELVKLDGLVERRPTQLSGGQQQRVALARALVFEPRLVLLDEPLGALDKQLREHLQSEIKAIHSALGVTMVYVTHDQSEALTMSDRIAVFADGRIQQIATPSMIYDAPRNAFVAGFVGENNRLDASLVERLDGVHCRARVEGTDLVLKGRMSADVAPADIGDAVSLWIRPEKASIGTQNAQTAARVVDTAFLGDQMRVRLSIPGNDAFIVKTAPQGGFARGAEITVGWNSEDCLILPAGP
jgi:putative spermidine/putrescine transport system ATP-binding protein